MGEAVPVLFARNVIARLRCLSACRLIGRASGPGLRAARSWGRAWPLAARSARARCRRSPRPERRRDRFRRSIFRARCRRLDGCARSPVTVRLSARSSDGKRASGRAARRSRRRRLDGCARSPVAVRLSARSSSGRASGPGLSAARSWGRAWPLAARSARAWCRRSPRPARTAWPLPAAGALPAFDLPGETATAGRLRTFAGGGAPVGAFLGPGAAAFLRVFGRLTWYAHGTPKMLASA